MVVQEYSKFKRWHQVFAMPKAHTLHGNPISYLNYIGVVPISKLLCSAVQSTPVILVQISWWRHRRGTFSAFLALCEGNPPVTDMFPSQGPVTRSFDVFFEQRLNKRLSTQSKRRWFETPSRSLWRHCNVTIIALNIPLRFSEAKGNILFAYLTSA